MRQSVTTAAVLVCAVCLLGLAIPASLGNEIHKSPNDTREYRYFQLANGLRAVVISELAADRAAASLEVAVGSGDDPPERPGLAHFLEHMLFLGTDKFPNPGEYQETVARSGGSQNAFTAFARTNYHFEVDAAALATTMERFARFFVAPRMDADLVERERQAVHAEYTSNLKNDGRRSLAALKQVINPAHPLAKFAVGNEETLADREGDSVREDLWAFYRRHYHAGNMTLAVLGGESLDELEALVRQEFAGVPGGQPVARQRPALFARGQLPSRLNVKPEREGRSLSLSFPIPPLQPAYRSKPSYLISHLLGDESEGSLLSYLRARGLANSLSAGPGFSHADFATFMITIGLTEAGLAQLKAVVESVFATIALVRARDVEPWRFAEARSLSEIDFRFMEQVDPAALTRALAHNLTVYDVADLLRGAYALETNDAAASGVILDALVPDNMLMTVVAPGVETDKKTPYYASDYAVRELEPAWIDKLRGLQVAKFVELPTPNPFVPDNLELLPDLSAQLPRTVLEEDGLQVWHAQDTSFGVPQSSFFVSLRTARANASPRAAMLTSLFVSMMNEQLRETAYPAALAGLSVQIYKHLRGVSFRISGYSDKQHALIAPTMNALRNPRFPERRFERVRARIRRALSNQRLASPYSQAMAAVGQQLLERRYSPTARLAALEQINLADLENFAATILDELEVVALAHGNISEPQALELAQQLRTEVLRGAKVTPVAVPRLRKLGRGKMARGHIVVEHADKAVVVYLQGTRRDDRDSAVTALLAQIMSSPFYDDLRTRQQLGYVVFASNMPLMRVPGLALVVQSPKFSTTEIESRIETFLEAFATKLNDLGDPEFAQHRESLAARLQEEDKTLGERSQRYWSAINRDAGRFDRLQRLTRIVRTIEKTELLDMLRQLSSRALRAGTILHAGREASDGVPGVSESLIARSTGNADYFD